MLSGYDKELEKAEKLTTQMLAQLSRGLNNVTDIKEFTRTISQLEKTYSVLNVKAASFADTNNYAKQNAEIRKYASELDQLVKKQNELKKVAASQVTAKGEKLKLDKEEINQLKKALDNAEAYKKIVDDITVAKAKALQQDINKAAIGSTAGQKALATTGTGNFEFGVAAKKGRDANRANLVKKGIIDVAAAQTAAQKEYQQVLQKTMQETGSAEDALKAFTEVMRKYKLEVTNADEVQEQFAQDMEKIANVGLNTTGGKNGKGGIDPNKKGDFTRRRDAINNTRDSLVNDADIQAYQSGRERQIQVTDQLTDAEKRHAQQQQQTVNNINKERIAAEQAGNSEINKRKQIIAEAQRYVSVQQSIENGFNRIGQGAKQILSVTTSWRALRNVVRSTFNDIKDLDKAFGSIAMVTSYSVKDMWQQYDQYAAMANKLGQSTKSVVEASSLYYQQGLKTNEVMQLTEETMKLATLAGLDFKEATSQMTAALRAFHMDMSEGAHVTDVYAEVAAHAAVDVQGLSEAMSATAAIAHSAGMAFETTTAMLATMIEATQEAPKNLGTAMKTILARFTELKNNVAGTADSEFDDLDYNKVDKALKSVGVSIKDATGQFRNMDDVLLELSGKWKGLDRNSQRYIATIAAGSRQQSRFIALMENYERTMQLVDVAQNSAGRSSQQFAKYQDTVEYRMKQISNTWEQFKTNLLTSDFYKDTLDNFKGFLEKLNDMSAAGLIALAGTWLTVGRKAVGDTLNSYSDLFSKKIGGGLSEKIFNSVLNRKATKLKEARNQAEENGDLELVQKLDNQIEENKDNIQKIGHSIGTILSTGITTAITSGIMIDNPVAAGLTAAGTSLGTLLPTFIQLGQTLGASTGTAIGAAVTVGIGVISAGISAWRKHLEEEENKKLSKQIENTRKQLEKQTELAEQTSADRKNTQNEIKDLEDIKKKYDELNSKIILTEEEQKEYNELVDNLKENYPNLIAQYDAENNQIKLSNTLLDSKIEKLKKVEEEQKKQETGTNMVKLATSQRLENLNLEQKYADKIKSELKLNVSTNDIRDYILNENSTVKTILENKLEPLDKINEILSDFKKEYEIVNKRQKKEDYSEWLAQYRNQYPDKSEAAIALMANLSSNFSDDTSGLKELFKGSTYFNDFNSEQAEQMGVPIPLGERALDWKKYSDIDKSSAAYEVLKLLGINSQEDLDKWKKDNSSNDQIEFLIEAIKKVNAQKQGEKVSEEAIKELEKAQLDFNNSQSIETLEQTYKRIEQLTEKYGSDVVNSLFNKEEIDKAKNLIEDYGLSTSKTFTKLSTEVQLQQSKILANLGKGYADKTSIGKAYDSLIEDIKKQEYPKKITNLLLSIDPTQLEGSTLSEAQETLMKFFGDAINAGEIGEEKAKEIINSYLDSLKKSKINSFSIKNTISLDLETKKVDEKLNKIVSNYKSAIDTINSNISNNGFINILDKSKIEEAIKEIGLDANKYFAQDAKGNFQIDTEKLNKDVKEQALNEENIVKQMQAEAELGLQELKLEQEIVQSLLAQINSNEENLTIERERTKELARQVSLKSKMDDTTAELTMSSVLADVGVTENEGVYTINQKAKEDLNDLNISLTNSINEYEEKIKDGSIFRNALKNVGAYLNEVDNIYKTHTDQNEEFKKSNDKAYKDWQDKTKAVADAQKSLAKAIEAVAEKQKELKTIIEGTNWKSSIDGMYNYNTALDFLIKQTDRAKKDLEKASTIDAAKRDFAVYGQGLLDQKAQLQAQNQIYRTAYNNIGRVYNNDVAKLIKSFEDSGQMKFNLADYLVFDEKTGTKINMNALQKAKMPEALKKWIETQGQKANEYLTKIWDNDDKVKQLNEEFIEHQRQALDGYVELQDKMIEVLREKYQKQVDDLKTKYEAMNEADDQYVDALQKNIDKQRKLRDQENSWNELADKERKLALLRRDTSRGNAVEVKSLEKEVQDDRTSLLDSAVDDIIEKLREFYELQKEQRELEITYQETLIDDVALMKEATEALQKIQTSDELVNWWKENVTEMEKMSDEKLQKEKQDWAELFKKKTEYVTSVDDTVLESIQNSEKNLKDVADKTEEIVRTTSEGITELASKSLEEAGEEYKKAVKTAKDALQDAVDAVAKQKEALQAAIDAANESKKAFDDIHAKYMEYLKSREKTTIYKVGNTYLDQGQLSSYMVSNKGNPTKYGNQAPVATEVPKDKVNDLVKQTPPSINSANNQWSTPKKVVKKWDYYTSDSGTLYTKEQYNSIPAQAGIKDGLKQVEVEIPSNTKHGVIKFNDKEKKWELDIEEPTKAMAETYIKNLSKDKNKDKYLAFAEGGLVNFTGPAWVDGSRSRPEAFLSAEDTRRIGEAARILADLPILSQPINQEQIPTTTIGDTTIQIDVHVDSIASDYDLDEAMDKVEKRIVEAAKYTGSNVILKKR